MKKIALVSCLILGFVFCVSHAKNEQHHNVLRIAVLDNPNLPEKFWKWSHYEDAYLRGISIAAIESEKKGVTLQYKAFLYGEKPLDILKQIPKVQKWKPDLILGPHYSNQFLILKRYFPNTMVLSSYATDPAIYKLPSNFYSLFPPEDTSTKALAKFIDKRFPNIDLDIIIQADCKNCKDLAQLVSNDLYQLSPGVHISETEFIGDNLNAINIHKITEKHQKGNPVLLEPINYYLFTELISRISEYLEEQNLVFFSILDSWGNLENVKKSNKLAVKYEAYRISLLLLDDNNEPRLKKFKQFFLKKYHKEPVDSVTYMTYLSVMSALTAMDKFPVVQPSMRESVLESYKKALASNPNWFRPTKYGIYYFSSDLKGETVVDVIPVFEKN